MIIKKIDKLNIKYTNREMKKTFKIVLTIFIFLTVSFSSKSSVAKTFYLDGNLSSDCTSGNYSIINRNCTGSDGDAYNALDDVINNLVGSDTLYIRNGTYIRTTNNTSVGSLHISVSGTAGQHTVVRNYGSEQPIICTETGRCQYNPNPGDTSVTVCHGYGEEGGAACYYPNPAIRIGAQYVDVIGLKTYGQVAIVSNNITVQNCDLGGGGPTINQGQVVYLNGADNITIKNNKIHHSCWGESNANGAAIMGYSFNATIENNEFYDNWGSDVDIKDTRYQTGKTIIVRNNFFKPSYLRNNGGFSSIGQYGDAAYVYVYNNIFYKKYSGVTFSSPAQIETVVYNNTFIDCTQDLSAFLGVPIKAYNNLHYHSNTGAYNTYFEATSPPAPLYTDYNVYFSINNDARFKNGSILTTTFSVWQGNGYDANSLNSTNPNFVNAAGNCPSDFKRTSYIEKFSSQYGVHAGAYQTGNEVIGLTGKRPSPPLNVR